MKEKTIPEIKAMVEKGLSRHTLVWKRERHAGAPLRWVGKCVLCHGWIAIKRGNSISQHSGDLSHYGLRFNNRSCYGAKLEAKFRQQRAARATYLRKVYRRGGIEAVIDAVNPEARLSKTRRDAATHG